jgi:hypothetical protein
MSRSYTSFPLASTWRSWTALPFYSFHHPRDSWFFFTFRAFFNRVGRTQLVVQGVSVEVHVVTAPAPCQLLSKEKWSVSTIINE